MWNCKFQRDRLRCGSFLHQIASILRRHSSHTSQKQVQKKTFEDKHFKIVGRAWFVADFPNVSYSTLLQLYLCSNMNSWKVYIRPAKNIIYLVFEQPKSFQVKIFPYPQNYDWFQCFWLLSLLRQCIFCPEKVFDCVSQTIAMIFDDLNGVAKMADPTILTPLDIGRHRENEIWFCATVKSKPIRGI